MSTATPDTHGNRQAQEGCDRCACGCKYWENDRCVDCGAAFRPTDLHTLASETDTKLADLWAIESASRFRIESEQARLDGLDWRGRELTGRDREQAEAAIAFHSLRVAEARRDAAPYEATYAAHHWSRFFLCTASGGHIHKDMACPTTFVTTQFTWLPELSGLTEADAVEAYGEILCSICFPSAPVAWTSGVSKAALAERDRRAAKKAEREQKRRDKALFLDPDDGIVGPHDTIKTIAAAKSFLTDAAAWNDSYARQHCEGHHPSYPPSLVTVVAQALADRIGEPRDKVIEDALKRAAKRGW